MDFTLSKEQKEIRQETIRFAREHLNQDEDRDQFSYDLWQEAADFGLYGLTIPEEFGGMEESYLTAAVVTEALGYACDNNGFVFAVNNHVWVGLNLIHLYGSTYLKNKYLQRMIQGNPIGAIAITEADAGSDAVAMRTSAEKTEDGFVLNGSKMFISNGSIAGVFIVFAKTVGEKGHEITAFVVDKDTPGVYVGKDIEKMGLNSCPMAEITFQNCRIGQESILGKMGAGNSIMQSALEWERCYEFACHIGAMERIMERCINYVNQRKQFGQPISSYQGVTHKIADMKAAIELSRLLLYKIAWMKDQHRAAYLETSIFKLTVSEAYIRTCRDAMQIFGAYGYTKEYGLENEMRDALACSIYSGTSEMQRNTIFRMSLLDVI